MTENVLYGIDLGTTNSCIALIRKGAPEVLAIEEGIGHRAIRGKLR